MSGETVPEIKQKHTFVKGAKTFILSDFLKAIDHTIVIRIVRSLCLESDFNDLERLHDEDLEPS